ncbi:MAG: alpha/beta hydrolase [Acidimicrobiales bacterium]
MSPSAERPGNEELTFVGSQGHRLAAVLQRPAGPAVGAVLLAHCFTCSKDLHTLTRVASGLVDAGYATLRFDFTGLGESGGTFAETTVSANVSDLTRAATTLIERGYGPCALVGHSLGGAAAILAAHRLKTVRSLVTLAAPASTGHVTRLFADELDDIVSRGRAPVTIGGRSFELDAGFVHDLHRHDVLAAVAALDRPYCVIHARDDDVVPFADGERLHAAAAEPRRLVAIDDGGHLFVDRRAADTVVAAIVAWLDETL